MVMNKSQFQAVIKSLYLKGLTLKGIKAQSVAVHATSAHVFATVYNWVNKFKCGHSSAKVNIIRDA